MTFRETFDKHLRAIRERDRKALAETLPEDRLVLIMSDGRLVRSAREFLDLHAGWFESTTWTLDAEPVEVTETPDLGVAVLHLDYRDRPPGSAPVHETSYLTLVFARSGEKWVMVHDQNTPIRRPGGQG
jgi:ketosteroid isomerase-like protein